MITLISMRVETQSLDSAPERDPGRMAVRISIRVCEAAVPVASGTLSGERVMEGLSP